MADLLGTSSSGTSTQLDQIVAQFKATQQSRVDNFTKKKTELETRQKFYNSLNSRFNSLVTQLDTFTSDTANDKFAAKAVTLSSPDVVSVSAEKNAVDGLNSIKVKRLATNDMLISGRYGIEDSFGELTGKQSFDITIGDETKTIEVELEGTETYEQAMKKIADAVNNTEDIKVTASFVKDTSTTGRLTFRSKELGEDFQIKFSDSEVLSKIGINNTYLYGEEGRSVYSATSAGFKTSKASELSSLSEINGIEITRNSNSLTDVLDGMSITLNKAQAETDNEITMTTDVNSQSVEQFIQPLLTAYNEILALVRNDKTIRRADGAIGGLYSQVRQLSTERVTSVEDGKPNYLSNIGISVDSVGNLTIGDKDRLKELLKENPQQVADMFTSSDGFVAKLNNIFERFKGDNGLIKQRTLSLSTQINDQQKRIDSQRATIDRQAETVRKQYSSLLKTYLEAQNQYSSFSAING